VKHRSLIPGFLEFVLLWTEASYSPSDMQLKVLIYITRTLHPVILVFKMKLIHIAGVLQTASHDGVHGMLEMLVSSYSEMNVVTFILTKFS
jgi:hypothetical protein